MEAKIFNQTGDEVGTIQLADYIFGIEPNMPVMHQAMVRQQANGRLGTSNTLRRGEVHDHDAHGEREQYRQARRQRASGFSGCGSGLDGLGIGRHGKGICSGVGDGC